MFWYDFDFWIIKNINSLSWNDFREFPIPVAQSYSPGANTSNRTSFIRASSRWPTLKADLSNDVSITYHSPVWR